MASSSGDCTYTIDTDILIKSNKKAACRLLSECRQSENNDILVGFGEVSTF
ncbi:hypothetical protein ACUXCC_001183 [Cytobacillus horneckiae]|uniref:hypothetical protein n=1 Tax=Cytobacillus horneckiae TaxID=549687 RepID=UPI0019CFFBF8|nr:hypothetical protein [Cytobacillus horneckiae]MBN6886502.1 hypothetical protein [Cytobacillus horneckiae]